MRYAIYEGNMERLVKKMTRIQNKCRKFGCDFRFAEVGEEFRTLKDEDGREYTARFVLIEAEGVAVINGWKFVAQVDHTDKGNVFSKAVDVEIPERYYNSKPVCEHCGTNRARSSTFIVMNEETGEFKQVGKSCLHDFTGGMSAEAVASYTAMFEELIEGEHIEGGYHGESYFDLKEWLAYAAETVLHFGYVKAGEGRSTRERAMDYYMADNRSFGMFPDVLADIRREMASVNFNAKSEAATALVDGALAWLAEQDGSSNYMHNLKTVCGLEYIKYSHTGIAASLFVTYRKDLERKEEQRKQAEARAASVWVGEIGKRITVDVIDITCVTGWETQWGYTGIYKITGEDGNIYTWKTGAYIPSEVKTLTGTVKDHTEFRGTKQTELTRCRIA